MATKKQTEEREQQIEQLRKMLPPGSTVHTILKHVSKSGMYRVVDLYAIVPGDETDAKRGEPCVPLRISWGASVAAGMRYDRKHEGVGVGGCGTDVGFEAVYNLALTLYPDGFTCIGERCPAADHSNGDRNYAPHHHEKFQGAYALRQRWL